MIIEKAINFATIKHEHQKRKGSNLPYIVHPMKVMHILTENNCSESVVVAGILHDTLEDTNTTYNELVNEFGSVVATLVKSNSEDKSKSWQERKLHTINEIKNMSLEEKQVLCADKLANLNSMVTDLNVLGVTLWERFNASKEDIQWYYRSIINQLENLQNYKMYNDIVLCYSLVFGKD